MTDRDTVNTPQRQPARRVVDESLLDDGDEIRDDNHTVFGLGIASADARQPAYGQGVVISLLAAGAVLLLAILAIGEGDGGDPPAFSHTDTVFWVIAGVTLLIAAGGAQFAERAATRAAFEVGQARSSVAMATAWAVPLVSAFAAVMLVATFHNRIMLVAGPLVAFFGIAGALLSRDLLDEEDEQSARVASVIHTLVIHAIAFLAFSAIYLNKLDSWVSVPLTAAVGGILVLETLERGALAPPQRVFYALLAAWVFGAATVPLNWWPTYGWTGGAVLLVIFYIVAGLMLSRAQKGTPSARDLLEFCGVGSAFLVLLAFLA
ncbi:MAG TPA: hypothetical protein VD767_10955 [Thermomicrobiales bacterium]|nr:hypothetical protein [Thermomicrobiales bacterium]